MIFDQFEELLLFGKAGLEGELGECEDFFSRLNDLIRYRVPCRVLLVMREEFIGHLSEFEHLCPSLFQHRFRLEKIRKEGVKQIISHSFQTFQKQALIVAEQEDKITEAILGKLPDDRNEIELAHLQVFLQELWDRALSAEPTAQIPTIHPGLIKKEDVLSTYLDSFLKKQLEELDQRFGKGNTLEMLVCMISKRHTKLQLTMPEIRADLLEKEVKLKSPLEKLIENLEDRRILRSFITNDREKFEISHDLLARVIGQNQTEEMLMREKANNIYSIYLEKPGTYSQEDLDYMRPYQVYRAFPSELRARVELSEAELSEQRDQALKETQKRFRLVSGLLVLALFALMAAAYYGDQASKSQKKQLATNEQLTLALVAEEDQRCLAEDNAQLAIWNQEKADTNAAEASRAEAKALANESITKQLLQESLLQQDSIEELRKEALAKSTAALNSAIEADAAKLQAEQKEAEAINALSRLRLANADIVELLLIEVDKDLLNLDFRKAEATLRDIAKLDTLKEKIFDYFLELAFWYNEVGNHVKSYQLLDFSSPLVNRPLSQIYPHDADADRQQTLRQVLQSYNRELYDVLWDGKYYPKMIPIKGALSKPATSGQPKEMIQDFSLARTETTVWHFALFCQSTGRNIEDFLVESWALPGDNPVVKTSWKDAQAYCQWLSRRKEQGSSRKYRLPTEQEWQYAAMGGNASSGFPYAGGTIAAKVAWFQDNSGNRTQSVESKRANEIGLYDMSGNVAEWCSGSLGLSPKREQKNSINSIFDVTDDAGLTQFIFRGGSWKELSYFSQVLVPGRAEPNRRENWIGFRVAY